METLVESVVEAAPHHEYLLIMPQGSKHLAQLPERVQRVYARSDYYSISEQFELHSLLKKHKVDLLHSPHFVVPLRKICATVCTIHDVIHLVYPQDIKSPVGRIYARWMMKAALRVSDKIITDSEYSKQDIISRAGGDPEKISVIFPFLAKGFSRVSDPAILQAVRDRYGIRRNYILYTGILRERKNHIGLLRAFAKLIAQGHDLDLVISGPIDPTENGLNGMAKELGLEERVVIAGFVPEAEISALYSGATIYACPSLYEGFGFTPLEAMACGAPVVCHNGTSLPEVCGDAALYSDARNPDEFARSLARVLEDSELREAMVERGFKNIQRYTARDSVDATLTLYSAL
jgi:glycosyltransferase involved in cell wall biosynthesis